MPRHVGTQFGIEDCGKGNGQPRLLALDHEWNLVALRDIPTTPVMASAVCATQNMGTAGTLIEIDRWEAGGWVGHVCGFPPNDFILVPGGAYFVRMTRAGTAVLGGAQTPGFIDQATLDTARDGAAWHDVRVTTPSARLDGDPISLGEGNTPVIRSRWLGSHLGLRNLWFKLEQVNPTGSYKDRFAARFITRHLDHGHPFVLATSSGNTGASLAAYSAAAGLPCIVCVPVEAPEAKLVQIRAYGARIVRVRGMLVTPAAVRILIDRLATVCASFGMPLGTSAYEIAPEAMAGIEPLGAELADAPSGSPDRIFAPIGGGGLLTAIFRGIPNPTSLNGHANRAIRIHGVQPAGNDTVVGPLQSGKDTARTLGAGEAHTAISGLGVPIDLDATRALHAIRSTGGDGHLVADTAVWDAQAMLARHEGLFIEPAGSTSVAGLIDAARAGQIGADDHVICVLTGHGFKDGPASIRLADHHPLDPAVLDATDLTGEYFARILN